MKKNDSTPPNDAPEHSQPVPIGRRPGDDTISDKRGFAARWKFSVRHTDNLLAQGLPHLKIGKRRVRIIVAEADDWMVARFSTRRLGPAKQEEHL